MSRFTETLRRVPAEPARPLPHYFQPLVRAIAGNRPVAMRTGAGTRAALAAAGKSAATVGGVIHLRRPPDRSPGTAEIVAHELVHAAHPSPAPRFFGDTRGGPEEALAERTGRLARALVAPRLATPPPARRSGDRLAWGTQGMAVGSMGGALKALSHETAPAAPAASAVAQRKANPGARPSLVERTADLFRRSAGSGGSGATGGSGMAAVGDPEYPRPGDGPIVRRSPWATGAVQREFVPSPAGATRANTTGGVDSATFDALVEALEQRVIDELERRGLRHHPGVF